jgi:toxin secretion/phage lysis holin
MNKATMTFVAVGVFVADILGGWDMWLQALVFATVIDYLTGIIAAAFKNELDSGIGFKGIAKKVAIFVILAVACKVAEVTGSELIRTATIMYYMANEFISVLENAAEMGVPIPEFLKKILKKMKDDNDKKDGD